MPVLIVIGLVFAFGYNKATMDLLLMKLKSIIHDIITSLNKEETQKYDYLVTVDAKKNSTTETPDLN
jgi:hypothetical protein